VQCCDITVYLPLRTAALPDGSAFCVPSYAPAIPLELLASSVQPRQSETSAESRSKDFIVTSEDDIEGFPKEYKVIKREVTPFAVKTPEPKQVATPPTGKQKRRRKSKHSSLPGREGTTQSYEHASAHEQLLQERVEQDLHEAAKKRNDYVVGTYNNNNNEYMVHSGDIYEFNSCENQPKLISRRRGGVSCFKTDKSSPDFLHGAPPDPILLITMMSIRTACTKRCQWRHHERFFGHIR
jgi:hypothetical protein